MTRWSFLTTTMRRTDALFSRAPARHSRTWRVSCARSKTQSATGWTSPTVTNSTVSSMTLGSTCPHCRSRWPNPRGCSRDGRGTTRSMCRAVLSSSSECGRCWRRTGSWKRLQWMGVLNCFLFWRTSLTKTGSSLMTWKRAIWLWKEGLRIWSHKVIIFLGWSTK